jgi:hypothetical protein
MAKILPDTGKVVSLHARKAYGGRMGVASSTFNFNTSFLFRKYRRKLPLGYVLLLELL